MDAHGQQHVFREKAPVVSAEELDAGSVYPCAGVVACTMIGSVIRAVDGRQIATVDTESPWSVESTEGICRFEVYSDQLVEVGDGTE